MGNAAFEELRFKAERRLELLERFGTTDPATIRQLQDARAVPLGLEPEALSAAQHKQLSALLDDARPKGRRKLVESAPANESDQKPAPDPFAEVRRWLEDPEAITGKGRRILHAILDAGGSLPLADMVAQLGLDWDPPYSNPYNKQQQRANEKLECDGIPYQLSRVDNRACLIGQN